MKKIYALEDISKGMLHNCCILEPNLKQFWLFSLCISMANTKNATVRQIIIDRCLSDTSRRYTVKDLMAECNRKLELEKMALITSPTTVRLDMENFQTHYGMKIVSEKVGRNVFYRYRRKGDSIFHSELKEDELQLLNQTMELLSRFEGVPHFEWLQVLNNRLSSELMMNPANKVPAVGFEEVPQLGGMEYFRPIYLAIVKKQVLAIRYQSFKRPDKFFDYTLHPYYLKEYNNRWFLFGWYDEWNEITNVPLDRIVEMRVIRKKYRENKDIDFHKFFENVIGVSFPKDGELTEVHLWVDAQQWPYIKSKPLHSSQEVLREYEDGSAEIFINVIPNFELESRILAQGMHMKVLGPEPFKQKLKQQIIKAAELYTE